jgi:hypothetical protein
MNDFSNGTSAPSSAPETLPDSMPSTPPTNVDEVVDANRHIALEQLARTEDISNYAQERADQAAVIDRGEEIGDDRKTKWYRRASKALSDATAEAQGILQPLIDQLPPPQSYQGSEYETDPVTYARKEGMAAQRVNAYFGDNQTVKQNIMDWGAAMDEEGHVARWLVENECQVAPQILERLAPSRRLGTIGVPPSTDT